MALSKNPPLYPDARLPPHRLSTTHSDPMLRVVDIHDLSEEEWYQHAVTPCLHVPKYRTPLYLMAEYIPRPDEVSRPFFFK